MAERERALEQVLAHPKEGDERTTRAEFDVLVEANAYMRKLVAETLKDSVTDEQLHQQFDRQYGSKVRVRHILVANPQDAIAVRARIDAGEDFAALARKLSLQRDTGERGGELLPFTANDSRVPANFRNIAFSMKPGDISDPVQVEGGYHLIKLEQIIQPVAVKFEDVKESLRDNVQKALIIQGVNAVRARLAQAAVKTLDIKDPVLLQELNARKEARTVSPAERLKADLDKTRNATAPTTKPASTQPTKPGKTTSTRPTGLVTPATRPAEAPATAPGASAPSGATTTPAPTEAPTTQP
jgi:parvulin-like peptidyl-prolyl isomerase